MDGLQFHIIHKYRYKETMKFELNSFNLLSVYSKNRLEGTLNFERLLSSFKGPSSQKKKEKEREEEKMGGV
jgi:hypothetical protein